MSHKKNNISSSFWNPNQVVTKVLLNISESHIESTPGIIKETKTITKSIDPTDPSDAVTLKYLKDNYTKENDPNPGFLPTTGGTMTGSIDMQGNNITDLVMYKNGQQTPVDHSAVTINYVNQQADVIKKNDKITNAITNLSSIDTQVAYLNRLLGINEEGITEEPESDMSAEFLKTSGGTVYGNIDMSQHTISDLGTPTNQDTKSAINVEFVQAKITSPQMAFLKNNDKNLSNVVVSEYFNWLQEPDPSQPDAGNTTTFSEKSPLWEEFFSFADSSRSEMVIQKTGILTFFMQGTWTHPANATTPSTDPITLELTVTAPTTTTTIPPITKQLTLSSGQSCVIQIPVQAVGSTLKLKYNNPNNNTGGTADPTGITLESFDWSLTLTQGNVTKNTTTPTP
ncbi:hypothetical protein DNC_01605 [Chlamydia muridarum]|uniref:Uncharacterized protein n=1 Tax=Chlamydia muridarum (strain MoPn / Nigg) TaxID=243161 RepID=Q9PKZ0_CHLMU|nr:hypothetical protein [Chlamydia muridarum]AAF39185.1 hypothetical protein TC_0320 [Chlamydia muridarum str. Nigg]AHH22710.1 hypothetical protein TAC_01675 [Chlamydia muridarum str. Nigg3 CMUT3-5]AHH23634.1 hypothetical protein Y015_01675 [Chlamydia muridarum str. Nigg CM972]AIT90521.1 hypothetical protein NC80_01590 [Chlamydia muridarum]AIT91407.1 hypothetical protein NC81_01605 [Chlamydia muridarum]